MHSVLRSALPIVVVILLATGIGLVTDAPTDQTGRFLLTGVLFSALVALIGGIQKWHVVPWHPTFAVAIAAVGYLLNEQLWVNVAMVAAGLAVIWHGFLREGRFRREHSQAHETRALGQDAQ